MEVWQEESETAQEAIGRTTLVELQPIVDAIERITAEIFMKRVKYEHLDGADVMVLSIVTKQAEHLKSVRTLIDAGQHRDALILSRSMFEAGGRLMWAFKNTPERTDQWFWFGAILDWRRIQKLEASGRVFDSANKEALKAEIDKRSSILFREKVRNGIDKAKQQNSAYQIPADPWNLDWTTMTLRAMFEEMQLLGKYEFLYTESSEWAHSGPRAILSATQEAEWGVEGFSQTDWRAAGVALQTACEWFLYCLAILSDHFDLGRKAEVDSLLDDMVAALGKAVGAVSALNKGGR